MKSLFLAFLLFFLLVSCEINNTDHPNIIFLMDDQHRWDAFGFIDPKVKTPTMDKLAKEGVFFDQAVCQAPMCVPSRYSLMFDLYPNELGVLSNRTGLDDEELPRLPLPQVLRNAGYQTAGFGKTHWRSDSCSTRGFEVRYIDHLYEQGAVLMSDVYPEGYKRYMDESRPFGAGEENNLGYLGRTSSLSEGEHRDGWVFEQCLDFIENGIDKDRPLFLYLSFLKPHASHCVPEGFPEQYDLNDIPIYKQPPWDKDQSPHSAGLNRAKMYEDFWSMASPEQWKSMKLHYWANCTWIDDMFRRTLNKLEQKGILENALVVYASDHGEMLGERYYRFNKYCFYESSVRVPIILSGSALPEQFKNTIDHRPAELLDVYPTILEYANIEMPQEGRGLVLTSGEKHPAGFSALHQHPEQASFMWRTIDYKLILVLNRKDVVSDYLGSDIIDGELYDLKKDPKEWYNLYSFPAEDEIRKKMTGELLNRLSQIEIKSLSPN